MKQSDEITARVVRFVLIGSASIDNGEFLLFRSRCDKYFSRIEKESFLLQKNNINEDMLLSLISWLNFDILFNLCGFELQKHECY